MKCNEGAIGARFRDWHGEDRNECRFGKGPALTVTQTDSWRDIALFVAIIATALALGGALAHAYELPNKIDLGREDYFAVQRIYSGWNRLAYVLAAQLIGILAIIFLHLRQITVLRLALVALGGWVASQTVFWLWTYPANQATENWTQQQPNWEALRICWEYSHLAGAAFQLLAMVALVVALLRRST
jgi:hypothetical protein